MKTYQLPHTSQSVKILQVSDCHLFTDTEDQLLGVNTEHSFQAVLHHIKKNHLEHHAIFYTGDIAQEPTQQTYNRFKKSVEQLATPYYCVAGNHDNPELMAQILPSTVSSQVIHTKYWDFILLNSHDSSCPAGLLTDKTLLWLKNHLTTNTDKHVAIFLHHHPVAMQSKWIDAHMLQDADKFWASLQDAQHVRSVSFSHVHQVFEQVYQGIQLFSVPATSVQFLPKSDDFATDNAPAGYRCYEFFSDGTLETSIERLHYVSKNLHLQTQGY